MRRFFLILICFICFSFALTSAVQRAYCDTSAGIEKLLDEIDTLNKKLVSLKKEIGEKEKKIEKIQHRKEEIKYEIEVTREKIEMLGKSVEELLPVYINWRKRLELLRTRLIAGISSNLLDVRVKAGVLNVVYLNVTRKIALFIKKTERLEELKRDFEEAEKREQLEKHRLTVMLNRLETLVSEKRREVKRLRVYLAAEKRNLYSDAFRKVKHTAVRPAERRESAWVFPIIVESVSFEKMNSGVIIRAPAGSPVVSVVSGTVMFSGWIRALGNVVIIRGDDGFHYIYAHLEDIRTSAGARIKRGEEIGRVGATGIVLEDGLYFEVRKGSEPIKVDMLIKKLKLARGKS